MGVRGFRRGTALLAGLLGCMALTAALTVAAPLSRPPVRPGGPPDAGVRVLQMNLCNSGWAGCYTGRAVAMAAAVIRAEAPDLVTLNEVCRDDVAVLAGALVAADHRGTTTSAFRSAMDRRTGGALRCRNGQPYGIALLARRSRIATDFVPAGGIYPVQDTRDPEERAWLCQDAVTFTACTTHLANSSAVVARAQCDYFQQDALPAVRALGAPAAVVLGGDFNLMVGGSPDVRSCVPAGDRRIDDGGVQNVMVTAGLAITAHRSIDMHDTTDHPGLLVTLAPVADRPAPVTAARVAAADRGDRCRDGRSCLLAAWRFTG